MSIFDGDYYDNINNPSKWVAIIVTDYKPEDVNWKRMEMDKTNIQIMLRKLGVKDENICELHNRANNVISVLIKRFCTLDKSGEEEDKRDKHDGYIMMFNLTYRKGPDKFRAGTTWYNPVEILNYFAVNNLLNWATKPKLIFYQTANNPTQYKSTFQNVDYPIEADIFQSFSNGDNEDSLGNENGSFYIQSLCKIINQHIDNGTIKHTDLMHIMYEVHDKVRQMVGNTSSQTPRINSSFIKKFKFPVS